MIVVVIEIPIHKGVVKDMAIIVHCSCIFHIESSSGLLLWSLHAQVLENHRHVLKDYLQYAFCLLT